MVAWLWYIILPTIVYLISTFNTYEAAMGMEAFAQLQMPHPMLPGWIFSVVWSIIYVAIAVALIMLYRSPQDETRKKLFILAGLNLLLNAMWGMLWGRGIHGWPMIVLLVASWLSTLVIVLTAWKPRHQVALLYLPYLIWGLVALYLGLTAAIMNHLLW